MDRTGLGQGQRPAGRDGREGHTGRQGRGRQAGAWPSGQPRDDHPAQAHGLRQRPGGRRARARGDAGQPAHPLARRSEQQSLLAAAVARPGAGRSARHRFGRPAGVDAGRARGAPAHRRRLGDGKGVPGARGVPRPRQARTRGPAGAHRRRRSDHDRCARNLSARHAGPAAPWLEPRRPAAEAREGRLAEPRAIALRADRRQEAADPAHVRAGRVEGGRAQTHPHRPRGAGNLPAGQWRYLGAHEKF